MMSFVVKSKMMSFVVKSKRMSTVKVKQKWILGYKQLFKTFCADMNYHWYGNIYKLTV